MADKKPTPKQILETFVRKPSDPEARRAAAAELGDERCVMRKADGSLDVGETLEAREFIAQTGQSMAEAVTFAEYLAALAPEHEADPITGAALFKGRTTDALRVDWGSLPRDRRLVAAYAAEVGQLPVGATSETVVDALSEQQPRAPWPRLAAEWATLEAKVNGGKATREERALAERVRDRLTFRRQEGRRGGPFPGRVEPAPALPAPPSEPGAGALTPVRLLLFTGRSTEEQNAKEQLTRHLTPMCRANIVAIVPDPPPGAVVGQRRGLDAQLATTDVIVPLLTADTVSAHYDELVRFGELREHVGMTVVPIVVSPVSLEGLAIGGIRSATEDPINTRSDRSKAWVDAAGALKAVAQRLRSRRAS